MANIEKTNLIAAATAAYQIGRAGLANGTVSGNELSALGEAVAAAKMIRTDEDNARQARGRAALAQQDAANRAERGYHTGR